MRTIRGYRLVVLLIAATVAAACQAEAAQSSFCDGIDADVGGCASDRPTFSTTTCAGVGTEFGEQLDARLRPIFQGPADVGGESRAIRAGHTISLTLSLANLHLRRSGIIAQCDADEFIAAAEAQFSAELKRDAGSYLADGPAVSYEVWLDTLKSMATIIDMEEDVPQLPTAEPT
jgi:hypothetical protein